MAICLPDVPEQQALTPTKGGEMVILIGQGECFDPEADFLVSHQVYVTWRGKDQFLPGGTLLVPENIRGEEAWRDFSSLIYESFCDSSKISWRTLRRAVNAARRASQKGRDYVHSEAFWSERMLDQD